jgi:hypothetical protein
MELTINDFEGYNNDCSDIKKIKSWIEEKGGTFLASELLDAFSKGFYRFDEKVVQHLKPNLIKQFVVDVLKIDVESLIIGLQNKSERLDVLYKRFEGVDNIEELLSYKQKLESEYKSKHYWLDKEIEKYKGFKNFDDLLDQNLNLKSGYNYKEGTVLQVLNYFFTQSFQPQSYLTTNQVMYSVLHNLCTVAKFEEEDFTELKKKFNFGYWGGNAIESFYRTMIISSNNSAWKSFEKALERTPFILKNRRMYEGIEFRVAENNKWTYYRCTGWNDNKKIKFVIDKEEKQRRFAFDNKEFKAFFKDKKIEL